MRILLGRSRCRLSACRRYNAATMRPPVVERRRSTTDRGRRSQPSSHRRFSRRQALAALSVLVVGGALLAMFLWVRSYRTPLSVPSFVPPAEAALPDCGTRVQSLVDTAAPGSTVVIPLCVARETITIGKSITLRGLKGAEIRGSDR